MWLKSWFWFIQEIRETSCELFGQIFPIPPCFTFVQKCLCSRPKVFCKKVFLEISQNWPESTCARVSFFSKVGGLNPEAFFHRIPLVVASVCTWYLNTSAVTLLLLRSNTAIYFVIVQLPHKLELYLAFYVSFIVFLLIVIHETNKILISNYY